ncbi:MAG TPA: leucyl aminopeptidase [Leptospiraceae bacterium]|nr:leucyl aminopeptidase [Leptospiraceae bacterium]HMW05230.1 leucyl aminopeptidase [Leptospiraceae bacterium]HMX31305.1 leucyl aminopeptidase [Leptospiraceae bacterium]HMY32111.1 leucyl aminopeptidase [Leptospiraceae bacterium]HMZ64672.1 leucyl aminopeptidase [Leptospiraceae bacterium]
MKLPSSKLKMYVGPNKSKSIYKVQHIFKDKVPNSIKKALQFEMDAKMFQADAGQQFINHNDQIIYIGLGEESKLTLRKLASYYFKLGDTFIKWYDIGLEIHISKELSEMFSTFNLVYQLANSLEIIAFPVDSLSKTFRDRKIEVGDISFVIENVKEEKFAKDALEKSKIVSKYLNESRYVEHLPANHFTPEEFVSRSKEIAKENKLKITVFDEDRLEKENFGGILSVCRGSDKKPKMIVLEYSPSNVKTKKTLALVGKGLTFDSGGISIKPSAEMHEMKYDMCGAAAVIHAIGAIAALGIKVRVIAAIGVAENMPDAAATKPGDVYTAYNGTTIEVQNTDAEGRLVLGDVISYVCKKYRPEYMVDLATLTGAVIIALGHEAAGVMTNSRHLYDLIDSASTSSEDRVWQLPLWEEYGEDLKSDIADFRNITGGRAAGTLSAAQFLANFVEGDVKWAHMDIAGTAWRSKASGTQINGPTGYGIRLLVDLAKEIENKP